MEVDHGPLAPPPEFTALYLRSLHEEAASFAHPERLERRKQLVGDLDTIRRDLDHLEESGVAKRTHGGVFYAGPLPRLPDFDEREPAEWDKVKHHCDNLIFEGFAA